MIFFHQIHKPIESNQSGNQNKCIHSNRNVQPMVSKTISTFFVISKDSLLEWVINEIFKNHFRRNHYVIKYEVTFLKFFLSSLVHYCVVCLYILSHPFVVGIVSYLADGSVFLGDDDINLCKPLLSLHNYYQ
jgi:hypothetical protein